LRTLIIIPASSQSEANAAAQALQEQIVGTSGGQFTFTVPLFAARAQDDSTPTNYWSAPNFSQLTEAQMSTVTTAMSQIAGLQSWRYDGDSNPGFPAQKLVELGLRVGRSTISTTGT